MLVLSRKESEQVVIDDRIVVTVVEIRGDKVRLGFDAERDVEIHRAEIWAKVCEERKGAAGDDAH